MIDQCTHSLQTSIKLRSEHDELPIGWSCKGRTTRETVKWTTNYNAKRQLFNHK
jgi:hypothetical protein